MLDALLANLIAVDQVCGQLVSVISGYEPQIYASIVLGALLWFFASPKDDRDQI